MPKRAIFAGSRFGDAVFGGRTTLASAETILEDNYTLEICNNINVFQAWLVDWREARWVESVNEPSRLEIIYPFTGEHASLLDNPYQIWLRNHAGTLLKRFRIWKHRHARTTAGDRIIAVYCQCAMKQLTKETVETYTATDETVRTIVGELLALQAVKFIPKVKRGSIPAAIGNKTRSLTLANQSIMEGLTMLQRDIGGLMYINGAGYLKWDRETGRNTGQIIETGKNLPGLAVETDYGSIWTKARISGKGTNPTNRVSVEADNLTAQGTYGVFTYVDSLSNEDDEDRLDDFAADTVRRLSKPKVSLSATVYDLSLCHGRLDYSDDAITCGSRVTFVDSEIDQQVTTRIVRVSRDLSTPVGVMIEVQDPNEYRDGASYVETPPRGKRDICDVIADLIRKLKDLELRDSGAMPDPTRLANDPTMLDDLADLLVPDVVDGIVADAAQANELADGLAPDVVDAIDDSATQEAQLGEALASDSTPQDVGATGAAGDSSALSRGNHVHKADPGDVADIIAADPGAVTTISTAVGGALDYTSIPERVGDSGSAGTGSLFSLGNHIHQYHSGMVGVIIQNSEPAAGDWPQGWLWINTNTSYDTNFHQIWIKCKSSGANNNSKIPLTITTIT